MRSYTLSLALAGPLAVSALSGSGQSTRYWDCCKPSCAWNDKASVSAPVLTCDKNDNPISDANAATGCGGGTSFTCSNNSPWAVNDNLAYGFAATKLAGASESDWCCACYALTFTSGPVKGKTMVVQSTNTGGDLGDNHFDIQMPGGGVGIFDGCTPQWGGLAGERYGGISSKSQCDSFPELLKDGCNWRFDWFENADNPNFTFEQVQCPKALTDITGCKRNDDSKFPAFKGDTSSGSSGSSGSSKSSTSKAATATAAAPVQASSTSKAQQQQQTQAPVKASTTSTSKAVQQTQAPVVVAPVQSIKTSAASKPTTTKASGSKIGSCPAKSSTVKAAATGAATSKAVAAYQQCGGSKESFPSGSVACVEGSKCVFYNDWYSQCVPN